LSTLTANEQVFTAESPLDTHRLGEALGRALAPGLVIALTGQLGAGKTHFTKGVTSGNGLTDTRKVTSPTFTLVHHYNGEVPVTHLDVYRLGDPEELVLLGFEEFVHGEGATIVEWADRVREVMPDDALWIDIRITGGEQRSFHVLATGALSSSSLENWHGGIVRESVDRSSS
ncbi:MAG: tRNA (adenosine(37)-N6)-threonylcarbamoyltransferase complex ATPase subunit type 1 TsaE, partial [Phycisphaerae bacterium]